MQVNAIAARIVHWFIPSEQMRQELNKLRPKQSHFHLTNCQPPTCCSIAFYILQSEGGHRIGSDLMKTFLSRKPKLDPELNLADTTKLDNSLAKHRISVKPKKTHASSHRQSASPAKYYEPKAGEKWVLLISVITSDIDVVVNSSAETYFALNVFMRFFLFSRLHFQKNFDSTCLFVLKLVML